MVAANSINNSFGLVVITYPSPLVVSTTHYKPPKEIAQVNLTRQASIMALGLTKMSLVVTAILMVGCVVCLDGKNIMGNGHQCEGDISGIISECAKYVSKEGKQTKPSSKCCGVLNKADIPCLCKYVTKDVEQYVDVNKALYVAQYCGLPLHHGFKCGSYTIPGA